MIGEGGAPMWPLHQCKTEATHAAPTDSKLPGTGAAPMKEIRLISCGLIGHVSDIKLIRTDTTLDLSQKAEKGMNSPVLLLPYLYAGREQASICGISPSLFLSLYSTLLYTFNIPLTCRALSSIFIESMSPSIDRANTCSPPNLWGNNTRVETPTPFIDVPHHN